MKSKVFLASLAFLLFSILIIGAFYLFGGLGSAVNVGFAYVVGLSMIVLPCTLPLAFVIVPLAMGKQPKKGLIMALLFGLGLALTLSFYGLFMAIIGKTLGLEAAVGQATLFSRILFIIGGLSAFIFGLTELKLINFTLPAYSGSTPAVINRQKDYLKAFFLGLFLGNAGVGCPNPLFYVLLGYIATLGSLTTGWWLGFIHGVGRATPLIFLSILGMLGVNAVTVIVGKEKIINQITGWTLVILGAFIIVSGTSHHWYEEGLIHQGWNKVVGLAAGDKIAEIEEHKDLDMDNHSETEVSDFIPGPFWPPTLLLSLIIIPIIFKKIKSKEVVKHD
ncbi:MAG: cytochrome c biogenesis protein CcdA [Patescibacteria group bacterium]|nr:cytochrome c biogenesis protein CcdA [Patescibacteria group bacterium]